MVASESDIAVKLENYGALIIGYSIEKDLLRLILRLNH